MNIHINLEFRMMLKVFHNRSHRVIARPPGSAHVHLRRSFLNYRIEHHTITTNRNKGCIRIEFSQHMLVRMIRIETYQYSRKTLSDFPNLGDHLS